MRQIYLAGNITDANAFSKECEDKDRKVYSIRQHLFHEGGSGYAIEFELSMSDSIRKVI